MEDVVAGTAGEAIVAVAAAQDVLARAAGEAIAAVFAAQDVVARSALDRARIRGRGVTGSGDSESSRADAAGVGGEVRLPVWPNAAALFP